MSGLAAALLAFVAAAGEPTLRIEPRIALDGIPLTITVTALDANGAVDPSFDGIVTLSDGSVCAFTPASRGKREITGVVLHGSGKTKLSARAGDRNASIDVRVLPGIASVLPPALAIVAAIFLRQVMAALVLGLFAAALLLFDFAPLRSLLAVIDTFVVNATSDPDHVEIIVFSVVLGGMIGVIQRSGGTHGIVDLLSRRARTPRSAQLATGGLGCAIFFDDYTSCLIVGSTMRPLTDRLRVSREKLAFLVHTTAAPIASLIPLSTWVGTQVGLVQGALATIEPPIRSDGFTALLEALPFCFYPVLATALMFATSWFDRERGPMLAAERRARFEGKPLRDGAVPLMSGGEEKSLDAKPGVPRRAINALVPIGVLLCATVAGLWITGMRAPGVELSGGPLADLREVIGAADSNVALLWGSTLGALVAIVLALGQRLLTLDEAFTAACGGARAMLIGLMILVLAWCMADVTSALHTKDWLAGSLLAFIRPEWFPLLVFAAGMAISFAIGTAWGTMAILMPLTIPTAVALARQAPDLDPAAVQTILLATIGATLGGAVFGNHASPLADNSILASLSSSADLFDHVRTQLPYTLLTALLTAACGYAPIALGLSPWLALAFGLAAAIAVVRFGFAPVEMARNA